MPTWPLSLCRSAVTPITLLGAMHQFTNQTPAIILSVHVNNPTCGRLPPELYLTRRLCQTILCSFVFVIFATHPRDSHVLADSANPTMRVASPL